MYKRYRKQRTKGIEGIIKVISEEITMFKWKLKYLNYARRIRTL